MTEIMFKGIQGGLETYPPYGLDPDAGEVDKAKTMAELVQACYNAHWFSPKLVKAYFPVSFPEGHGMGKPSYGLDGYYESSIKWEGDKPSLIDADLAQWKRPGSKIYIIS